MSQEIAAEQTFDDKVNRTHETFLVPFFTEMNLQFANQWCVLHSYETLPYYSESDVDMAFSRSNLRKLELLINKVAAQTGWKLYQKLWYDVQCCCYYVLREEKFGTLLAIDFLSDNHGIGSYGFKTTVLNHSCNFINGLIPIPNHETALAYKLVKRIEKGRTLAEDEIYIKKHFERSDKQKITSFLEEQYGTKGKEILLSYLNDNKILLSGSELLFLKHERKKRITTIKTSAKFAYWEMRRILYRIYRPSGILVNIPLMDEKALRTFTEILKLKVGILFRFVQLDADDSQLKRFKGIIGSTLVICPQATFSINKLVCYQFIWPRYLPLNKDTTLNFDNLDMAADRYFDLILKALSIRVSLNIQAHG